MTRRSARRQAKEGTPPTDSLSKLERLSARSGASLHTRVADRALALAVRWANATADLRRALVDPTPERAHALRATRHLAGLVATTPMSHRAAADLIEAQALLLSRTTAGGHSLLELFSAQPNSVLGELMWRHSAAGHIALWTLRHRVQTSSTDAAAIALDFAVPLAAQFSQYLEGCTLARAGSALTFMSAAVQVLPAEGFDRSALAATVLNVFTRDDLNVQHLEAAAILEIIDGLVDTPDDQQQSQVEALVEQVQRHLIEPFPGHSSLAHLTTLTARLGAKPAATDNTRISQALPAL